MYDNNYTVIVLVFVTHACNLIHCFVCNNQILLTSASHANAIVTIIFCPKKFKFIAMQMEQVS